MPFKKTGKDRYKTPSGKTYTKKQVRAYHASAGWKRKPRKVRSPMNPAG